MRLRYYCCSGEFDIGGIIAIVITVSTVHSLQLPRWGMVYLQAGIAAISARVATYVPGVAYRKGWH